jgi:hypothetical protein
MGISPSTNPAGSGSVQFPIPPSPSASVISRFPAVQDIRQYINQLIANTKGNPDIVSLAKACKSLQQQLNGLIGPFLDLVSYLNQSASDAFVGPGWTVVPIVLNTCTITVTNPGHPIGGLAQVFKIVLNQSTQVTINPPIWAPISNVVIPHTFPYGTFIRILIFTDATANRPTPVWTSGATGFGADVQAETIDGTPSTRSTYEVMYMDDNKWHLINFNTGKLTT